MAVPGDTDLCARTAALEAAVPVDTDLRVRVANIVAVLGDTDLCAGTAASKRPFLRHMSLS